MRTCSNQGRCIHQASGRHSHISGSTPHEAVAGVMLIKRTNIKKGVKTIFLLDKCPCRFLERSGDYERG